MRKCPICTEPVIGRSDKKFCSVRCKNRAAAPDASPDNLAIHQINKTLRKNHRSLRILLAGTKKRTCDEAQLTILGFSFSHFTGTFQTQSGMDYTKVYNLAYHRFADGNILIVENR